MARSAWGADWAAAAPYRSSAIWTAFNAAPLRRLSATTKTAIPPGRGVPAVEAAMAHAAHLVLAGDHDAAGRAIADMLADAPRGNAAWTVPIEPLLQVGANPAAWTLALARLRNRAA